MDPVKHPLAWWLYGGYPEVTRHTGWSLPRARRGVRKAIPPYGWRLIGHACCEEVRGASWTVTCLITTPPRRRPRPARGSGQHHRGSLGRKGAPSTACLDLLGRRVEGRQRLSQRATCLRGEFRQPLVAVACLGLLDDMNVLAIP